MDEGAVKERELAAKTAAAQAEKTEQVDNAALLVKHEAKLKSDYTETVTQNLKISAARKLEIDPDKLSESDLSTISTSVKRMVGEKFPEIKPEKKPEKKFNKSA